MDCVGTVYLAPNGDVYRLRWFTRNRRSGEQRPDYAIIRADGLHSDSDTLPGGAITIHEPTTHEFYQAEDNNRCACGSPVEDPIHRSIDESAAGSVELRQPNL